MSGDQNPGRSPSGCSSASRAPASGAGGRRSKACHQVHPASRCALRRILHSRTREAGCPPQPWRRRAAPAPLAQLAERSAYTRRELRTGARLEVRILQGVPSCFAPRASQDLHPRGREAGCPPKPWRRRAPTTKQRTYSSRSSAEPERGSPAAEVPCSNHGATTEGSAEWSATGPENQGDREVRGSIPQPSSTLYHKPLLFQ